MLSIIRVYLCSWLSWRLIVNVHIRFDPIVCVDPVVSHNIINAGPENLLYEIVLSCILICDENLCLFVQRKLLTFLYLPIKPVENLHTKTAIFHNNFVNTTLKVGWNFEQRWQDKLSLPQYYIHNLPTFGSPLNTVYPPNYGFFPIEVNDKREYINCLFLTFVNRLFPNIYIRLY